MKTAKIAVSPEADSALDRMVKLVNSDFLGGKISKHKLASWIICQFDKEGFESSISAIHRDNFDKIAYLEAVTKRIKEERRSGNSTIDLEQLLSPIVPRRNIKRRRKVGPVPIKE